MQILIVTPKRLMIERIIRWNNFTIYFHMAGSRGGLQPIPVDLVFLFPGLTDEQKQRWSTRIKHRENAKVYELTEVQSKGIIECLDSHLECQD